MSEMGVGLSDLPDGWVWTTLGEVCQPPQYGWTTRAQSRGTLHLLRTTDITSGSIDWETVPFCQKEPDDKKKYLLKDGDVVISRAGSVGFSCLIRGPKQAVFASYLIRFRPVIIDELFLSYFLKSPAYWLAVSESKLGIAVQNVNATKLKKIALPIAPLPEQHRIVAKIEELFTKLDAGINELHKAQSQLKRYRQSVLKAAFEGKLTETWRAKHQDDIEPASVLLERILKERREKWEAEQLEGMQAKRKTPKDDKWKTRYKEPIAPDTSDLSELPEGWKWIKLEQVTDLITKGSSPKWQGFNYVNKGILFLRSQNVGWGGLDLSNIAHLPEAFNKKERKSILETGDVLLNLVGASIGRTAIASDKLEGANMNQAVALIRLVKDGLDNKFLMNYLLSSDAQSTIHEKKVDVARANLSLTDVSEFAVPLPPLLEQQAIVSEVESRLSITDEVEKTVTAELKRAEQLRQSILKKAFSGKLVPQDPNDEPASALLERIKAEKVKHIQGQLMLNV